MPRVGERPSPVLALVLLGLVLVPVQCTKGLHPIFVSATTLAPAAAAERHLQHAARAVGPRGSHDDHAGIGLATSPAQPKPVTPSLAARSGRASSLERSTPTPVKSALFDQPYTIALNRAVPTLGPPLAHAAPLLMNPLVPDAMTVVPEPPPPRSVA